MHTLKRFDPKALLTNQLGQPSTVRVTARTDAGGHLRVEHGNTGLVHGLDLAEFQGIAFNGLADGLEMVVARGHVRVPEFVGVSRIRAQAAAYQANGTGPQVRPLGTASGQVLHRNVPVGIGPPFLVEPDAEKYQGAHQQIAAQLYPHRPNIGLGQIGQAHVAIQKGIELRGAHLTRHAPVLHEKNRRVAVGGGVGRNHSRSPGNRLRQPHAPPAGTVPCHHTHATGLAMNGKAPDPAEAFQQSSQTDPETQRKTATFCEPKAVRARRRGARPG